MKTETPSQSQGPSTKMTKSQKSVTMDLNLQKTIEVNKHLELSPPDGGWGWVVVGGYFVSSFITEGVIAAFGTFLQDMSVSFNTSKSMIANTGAVKNGIFCVVGPFAAALVNRYSFRIVALIGSVIAIISNFCTSLSTNLVTVICVYGIVGGIGNGMIYISGVIAVGFYFEKWRSLASSLAACGSGMGSIIMPTVLQILQKKYGWRDTFQLLSLISVMCLISSLTYRPLHKVEVEDEEVVQQVVTSHVSVERPSGFFNKYHNMQYPSVKDGNTESTVTIMQPNKLNKASSEFMGLINPEQKLAGIETRSGIVIQLKEKKTCWRKYCSCCLKQKRSTTSGNISLKSSKMNKKRFWFFWKKKKIALTRPLYRDDIFYEKSLDTVNLQRRSTMTYSSHRRLDQTSYVKSPLETRQSVTRQMSIAEYKERKCTLCTESVKRVLATMLDYRLLKSMPLLFMVLNASTLSLTYYVPYYYSTERAIKHGMNESQTLYLVSTIGTANTVGRFACGLFASIPCMRTVPLCYVFLMWGGIVTGLSGLSFQPWYQFFWVSVFGFSTASMSALRTVILVDYMGLDKLTNCWGMILLFQGISNFLGMYFAGWMLQIDASFNLMYYYSGTCMVLSGLFLIPLHVISNRESKKLKENRQ